MASIAVLPVLLGLAVDYAIQYQARRARRWRAIATAALATAVGFLVLLLSPVPMVRGFGALLVVGVGVALAVALTAGTAVLALAARRRASTGRAGALAARRGRARSTARAARAAARAVLRAGGGAGCARDAARVARAAIPARVLVVARRRWRSCGWALDARIAVVSELPRLVPQDLAAVRDLDALQRDTGVAGEVDVLVEGDGPDRPEGDRLDARLPGRAPARATATTPQKGCAGGELCPALSLPGPVPHARAVGHARADPRAAGRRPAVLLAGRDHARPRAPRCSRSASGCSRWRRQREVIAGHARAAAIRRAGVTRDASPGCPCWPRTPTTRSATRCGGC